jgi:hypothetical protein
MANLVDAKRRFRRITAYCSLKTADSEVGRYNFQQAVSGVVWGADGSVRSANGPPISVKQILEASAPDYQRYNFGYATEAVIRSAPPCRGDFAGDDDVDLVDFGEFQLCYTGPGGGPIESGCQCGDFDGDRDIDLVDFGAFQLAFTGN